MSKHFPCSVTTIFSRRVRPGFEDAYEEWLRGINEASAEFPGSQGTVVIRPGEGRGEYVAVVQFDTTDNLERWMESPERADWLKKLDAISLDSEEVSSLTGMERWFTLPDRSVTQAPPKYKSALLLVLGLYPVVLLLNPLVLSFAEPLPGPVWVFVTLLVSVPLMVWVVMPQLTRLFFRWLYPEN